MEIEMNFCVSGKTTPVRDDVETWQRKLRVIADRINNEYAGEVKKVTFGRKKPDKFYRITVFRDSDKYDNGDSRGFHKIESEEGFKYYLRGLAVNSFRYQQ